MGQITQANVKLVNGGVKFECTAGDHPPIITDYVPPLGDGEGYVPLQLLLISMATCAGGTVALLIRKFRKDLQGLSISMRGTQDEERPHAFTRIDMEFTAVSADATEDDVKLAITKTEEKYCPVWAMIKGNVEVVATAVVKRP